MKTVAEIDAEIAKLEELRRKAEESEAVKKLKVNYDKAVETLGRLVDDLRFLDEAGYLPPKIQAALTDASGKFNPRMYVKRPRPPKDA